MKIYLINIFWGTVCVVGGYILGYIEAKHKYQ